MRIHRILFIRFILVRKPVLFLLLKKGFMVLLINLVQMKEDVEELFSSHKTRGGECQIFLE